MTEMTDKAGVQAKAIAEIVSIVADIAELRFATRGILGDYVDRARSGIAKYEASK